MASAVSAVRAAGRILLGLPRDWAWLPALAWFGLITWFSSRPSRSEPGLWIWGLVTNCGHAPLFGFLGLLLALILPRERGWARLDRGPSSIVLAGVLCASLVDELHQGLVPGRDFSLLDVLTNLVGAAAVLSVARYAGRTEAPERGLVLRLGAGLAASLAAGGLASLGSLWADDLPWL
jgi:VanZ family protein